MFGNPKHRQRGLQREFLPSPILLRALTYRFSYVNNVTGVPQDVPPPTWSGGILADEMGLGKTLQMISLVAAGKQIQEQSQLQDLKARQFLRQPLSTLKATLIVVPVSGEAWLLNSLAGLLADLDFLLSDGCLGDPT